MGFRKIAGSNLHRQGDCRYPFKSPSTFHTVTVAALAIEAAECSAEQFVLLHLPLSFVAFSKHHNEESLVVYTLILQKTGATCYSFAQKDLAGIRPVHGRSRHCTESPKSSSDPPNMYHCAGEGRRCGLVQLCEDALPVPGHPSPQDPLPYSGPHPPPPLTADAPCAELQS